MNYNPRSKPETKNFFSGQNNVCRYQNYSMFLQYQFLKFLTRNTFLILLESHTKGGDQLIEKKFSILN